MNIIDEKELSFDGAFSDNELLSEFKSWVSFDNLEKIFDIGLAIYDCAKNPTSPSCAKDVFNVISDFEPTGIASLAKSLIYPTCPEKWLMNLV